MQQSRHTAQGLYRVVLPIPSHHGNPTAANALAQGVIAPICRQGVSAANR
ncbi:MAG TPA: hypothetical protein VEU97_04960 [Ktedonobacteraceae bacterium]|nr:hypothetical protein [Ktedonobacteraceae bacterium]